MRSEELTLLVSLSWWAYVLCCKNGPIIVLGPFLSLVIDFRRLEVSYVGGKAAQSFQTRAS